MRNVKPGLKWGMWLGTLHGGVHMWLNDLGLGALVPWTLRHDKPDHESLRPAAEMPQIDYPKYDGVLTFDKLSSVFLSNTNHEEDQPVASAAARPVDSGRRSTSRATTVPSSATARPASTSSSLRTRRSRRKRLQINAQNCVHCKTCDIKDPRQNIHWVTPEGGGGPNYSGM